VHLDFVVLPAWLFGIRHLVTQQRMAHAALLALLGLVLALLAGTVNRSLQGRKQAKQQGRVTPAQAAARTPTPIFRSECACAPPSCGWHARPVPPLRVCTTTAQRSR
jgi:hypothetical protein